MEPRSRVGVRRIVLDTDVSSQIIKGRLAGHRAFRRDRTEFCVSFVTAGELWQWVRLRGPDPRLRTDVEWWLRGVNVLHSDESTTRTWGEISAYARQRGRPKPDNDTWIAATCLANGLPLLTGNVKDFADYVRHEGLTLVSS